MFNIQQYINPNHLSVSELTASNLLNKEIL